nr:fad-dependent monooxygenase nscc [Quercus suber]
MGTPTHVHILGAGLAGLVLARSLKRLNPRFAVTLYERDTAPALAKRHGYAIALRREVWKALVPMLGGGGGGGGGEQGAWERVGVLKGRVEQAAEGGAGEVRVNRKRLEEVLREGLEVQTGHEVREVGAGESGGSMRFGMGQDEEVLVEVPRGDVVVGADGVHSQLRRALLPEVESKVLPFVAFNGKRRVVRKLWEDKYRVSFPKGHTVLQSNVAGGATLLRISIDEVEDERVSISYTYSRPAKKEQAADALYKPNRPNAGAKDIPDELFEELRGIEHELEGALKEVFSADAVRRDRLLHWLMRSVMVPQQDLVKYARSGVLFVGDAVHHAPIIGSEGANEAVLDAMDLATFLTGAHQLSEWYSDTRYVQQWREHVNVGVKSHGSVNGIVTSISCRPVISRMRFYRYSRPTVTGLGEIDPTVLGGDHWCDCDEVEGYSTKATASQTKLCTSFTYILCGFFYDRIRERAALSFTTNAFCYRVTTRPTYRTKNAAAIYLCLDWYLH